MRSPDGVQGHPRNGIHQFKPILAQFVSSWRTHSLLNVNLKKKNQHCRWAANRLALDRALDPRSYFGLHERLLIITADELSRVPN